MTAIRYRASREVAWEQLADEVALLQLERGVYYGLNPTGRVLWERLVEPATIDDLAAVLGARCGLPPEECRQDVERLVAELEAADLVVRLSTAG